MAVSVAGAVAVIAHAVKAYYLSTFANMIIISAYFVQVHGWFLI